MSWFWQKEAPIKHDGLTISHMIYRESGRWIIRAHDIAHQPFRLTESALLELIALSIRHFGKEFVENLVVLMKVVEEADALEDVTRLLQKKK